MDINILQVYCSARDLQFDIKLNTFQTFKSSQLSKRLDEEWLLICSPD